MRTCQVSVVHSHPPSHNKRNKISMTPLIYNRKHYSLTCENNKLTVSLAASIAPLSFFDSFSSSQHCHSILFRPAAVENSENPTEPYHFCFPIVKIIGLVIPQPHFHVRTISCDRFAPQKSQIWKP